MPPFTAEQFFAVFADYNAAFGPAAPIAYVVGAVAVAAVFFPTARSGGIILAIVAAMWLWTGVAYHWVHFAPINPAARLFGAAFVVQGGLLLSLAGGRGLRFGLGPHSVWRRGLASGLIAYAMIAYPLVGLWAGHEYSELPMFGVTPCPLTIFTFGLLLLAVDPVPGRLLAVPALWSLVGGSAAFLLGVAQDWMLPFAGFIGTWMLICGRLKAKRPSRWEGRR